MLDSNNANLIDEYTDVLNAEAGRPARLAVEYLSPELKLQEARVASTAVIFGSARILSPEAAQAELATARKALAAAPDDSARKEALRVAEKRANQSRYYQVARDFAALITHKCQMCNLGEDKQLVVLTGGGPGIMEAGNRGASDMGGISAALNICLPHEQLPNPYITPELNFELHYFSIRKMHFLKRAKVVACFPGGWGTFDELFETLTLIQTGICPKIPVLLFGREFWTSMVNWDAFVQQGLISPEDLDLITYCETAQDGLDAIAKFYSSLFGKSSTKGA